MIKGPWDCRSNDEGWLVALNIGPSIFLRMCVCRLVRVRSGRDGRRGKVELLSSSTSSTTTSSEGKAAIGRTTGEAGGELPASVPWGACDGCDSMLLVVQNACMHNIVGFMHIDIDGRAVFGLYELVCVMLLVVQNARMRNTVGFMHVIDSVGWFFEGKVF